MGEARLEQRRSRLSGGRAQYNIYVRGLCAAKGQGHGTMSLMDTSRPPSKKTSDGLIRLGLRYAREDGVFLTPDETVPMGWLTANHETGRSDVAATATEPLTKVTESV
jgi:hypothetical protein